MSLDFYLYGRAPIFDRNITHNLIKMAAEAGIYECLWEPQETGYKTAAELIEPLREGLRKLKTNPEHFQQFNASNGWGTYEDFVPFVEAVLAACEENPDAEPVSSR